MNAITVLLAALVFLTGAGCAALEEQVPALDTAATKAAQTGGCIRVVCHFPPIQHCRPAVGRCERN